MNSALKINKNIFKKHKVKIAYLYGSRTKGNAVSESDYDLAVLFKDKPYDSSALEQTTFLSSELNKFFPTKLDVVCLNDAPSLLKYEVVSHNQLLYCENEKERINFEVSVIKEYIDEEPIRKLYNQALYKRILQGA